MCILCQSIIRSETVWPIHLNSKVHKENIVLAKKTKLETENIARSSNGPTFKRPCSPSENNIVNKQIKGILKNSIEMVPQGNSSLPGDFFDDNAGQTNSGSVPIQKLKIRNSVEKTKADVQNMEIEEEKEKDKRFKDLNPAALPEGFFDDPVMDAKVS